MRNIRFTPSKGTLMKYRSAETKLCFVTVKILHQIVRNMKHELETVKKERKYRLEPSFLPTKDKRN